MKEREREKDNLKGVDKDCFGSDPKNFTLSLSHFSAPIKYIHEKIMKVLDEPVRDSSLELSI